MILFIFQSDLIERLLKIETLPAIGLLLAFIALLIYDRVKQDKKYSALQKIYENEQNENKKLLIELVSKSILATEQNTQAINTLRDVYSARQ